MAKRKGETREEYLERTRERKREYDRKRRQDPEVRERHRERMQDPEVRERKREYDRKRRQAELEALGNPTDCDICGKTIPPKRDGSDGRHVDHRHDNGAIRGVLCSKCNTRMAVWDLQATEPEIWQKMSSYGVRNMPVRPGGRENRSRRRARVVRHPTLFDPEDES